MTEILFARADDVDATAAIAAAAAALASQSAAESAAADAISAAADTAADAISTAADAASASSSASSAASSYDSFDDRYLGAKAADPTLDNDGNALITGALYFNTVSAAMKVYDGASWLIAYNPAASTVDSVFGRTGVVVATAGDYTATLITNTPAGNIASTTVQAALNELDTEKAKLGANTDITSIYLNNTGLKIKDTNASHGLSIVPGSDITADRTLTVVTGDADRSLTVAGTASITGTNTGDQTITLTGDITGSGTGSFATTVAKIAGVTVSGTTGTNLNVFSDSPTLVTPTLGAATATTINKVTITAPATAATLSITNNKTLAATASITIAGTDGKTLTVSNSGTLAGGDGFTLAIAASKTLTVSNTGTLAGGDSFTLAIAASKTLTVSNTLTFSGTDSSTLAIGVGGTLTGSSSAAIFYDNIPQQSKSAAYTTVLGDAQKHILHPSSDNNARTFTIDSNANVAYPVGTAITFINMINTVTIAITSDTMTLMGTGGTGSRTLAANGIATAVKISSTAWVISGVGLT